MDPDKLNSCILSILNKHSSSSFVFLLREEVGGGTGPPGSSALLRTAAALSCGEQLFSLLDLSDLEELL